MEGLPMDGAEVNDARLGLLAALLEEILEVVEAHGLVRIFPVADADGADLGGVAGVLVQKFDVTLDGVTHGNVALTHDVRLVER